MCAESVNGLCHGITDWNGWTARRWSLNGWGTDARMDGARVEVRFGVGGLVRAAGCGWSTDSVTPPKYGGAGAITDGKTVHE